MIDRIQDLFPGHIRQFHQHVQVGHPAECWEWKGRLDRYGYGVTRSRHGGDAIWIGAHRVAYLLEYRLIPSGLVIDHLCRNRKCCNPRHMEAVTNRENIHRGALMDDGISCRNGHPRTLGSTRISPTGVKICRECERQSRRRYYERLAQRQEA
jgi:hypothetical protein